MVVTEVEQGHDLPSFSSHTVNSVLFMVCLVPCLSHFCVFWGEILLFKVTSKCRAEVLSSVPKCNKVVMYLTEKIENMC